MLRESAEVLVAQPGHCVDYQQHLAGNSIEDTLRPIGQLFDQLWQMLAPPDEIRRHAGSRLRASLSHSPA